MGEIHPTQQIEGGSIAAHEVVADAPALDKTQVQVLETVTHEIGVGKQEQPVRHVTPKAHTTAVYIRSDVWPRAWQFIDRINRLGVKSQLIAIGLAQGTKSKTEVSNVTVAVGQVKSGIHAS